MIMFVKNQEILNSALAKYLEQSENDVQYVKKVMLSNVS